MHDAGQHARGDFPGIGVRVGVQQLVAQFDHAVGNVIERGTGVGGVHGKPSRAWRQRRAF
jgi:hypothetical protein